MYICKDCKTEYKKKPTYCECGNNTFDIINNEIGLDFSKIFFLFCILLSTIILILPVKNQTPSQNAEKKQSINKNIPTIDSFWDNTTIQKQIQPIKKNIQNKTRNIETTSTQKIVNKISNKKNAPTQTNKKTNTTKINKNTKVTNTTKKTTTNKNNSSKNNPTNSTKKTTERVVKNTPVSPKPPTTTTQNKIEKNTQQNNAELYNYKLSLRQALFSNLSITSVQGSGKCQIEFSIDKTGKLINRAFTYQSNNKSLNDEVYKMLMKMPKFYPPPKSYNGEKLKLFFEFNNGNFTINYTN